MFNFREFIKKGILDSIGKEVEYKVRFNAGNWYDKGVLTDEDMEEIQFAIDEYNALVENTEI